VLNDQDLEVIENIVMPTNFSFIQLADPQFGLFADRSGKTDEEISAAAKRGQILKKTPKITGFADETRLFSLAIEQVQRSNSAFMVVSGDIINEAGNEDQIAEVKRIAALLDKSITIRWVSGNHDVAFDRISPDQELIDLYRENFGPDYYAFSHQNIRFLVINSTLLTPPNTLLLKEAWDQVAFVEHEAMNAKDERLILLSHHPLFIKSPDEPDSNWSIEKKYRNPLLEMAKKHGIEANFAGHLHRNNIVATDYIEVVASGPVGYPSYQDPSGFRRVQVTPKGINHQYHPLETTVIN